MVFNNLYICVFSVFSILFHFSLFFDMFNTVQEFPILLHTLLYFSIVYIYINNINQYIYIYIYINRFLSNFNIYDLLLFKIFC